MAKKPFFKKDMNVLANFKNQLLKDDDLIDRAIKAKIEAIINVVYRTAVARRPKISITMQKALGRSTHHIDRATGKKVSTYRVSDPNAEAGVPVKTGALQISIKKEVKPKGLTKWIGRVYVDKSMPGAKYAKYMEYGTSRVRARPFMRPALFLNKEWIERKFKEPIKK